MKLSSVFVGHTNMTQSGETEASIEANTNVGAGSVARSRPFRMEMTQPVDEAQVPYGMDTASYLAGERAAYARALSVALPAQQALGQLFQAVDGLNVRVEKEGASLVSLQVKTEAVSVALDFLREKINGVEQGSIPSLQHRCDELAARPLLSPEISSALQNLRDVLANLSTSQQAYLEASLGYAQGPSGALVTQLRWLLQVGTAAACSTYSAAEVAAVFLSRRILIGDIALLSAGDKRYSSHSSVRSVLGAALFVGLVEGMWQMQFRVAKRLPRAARSLNAPLREVSRIARIAVWSSVFVLGMSKGRSACMSTATWVTSRLSAERKVVGEQTAIATSEAPYSPSLAKKIAFIEAGLEPSRPSSAGSPAPPPELLRENQVFDGSSQ